MMMSRRGLTKSAMRIEQTKTDGEAYAMNIDFNRSRASKGHVSKQLLSVASDLNTGASGFGRDRGAGEAVAVVAPPFDSAVPRPRSCSARSSRASRSSCRDCSCSLWGSSSCSVVGVWGVGERILAGVRDCKNRPGDSAWIWRQL